MPYLTVSRISDLLERERERDALQTCNAHTYVHSLVHETQAHIFIILYRDTSHLHFIRGILN